MQYLKQRRGIPDPATIGTMQKLSRNEILLWKHGLMTTEYGSTVSCGFK
jgi:hypothetical protein